MLRMPDCSLFTFTPTPAVCCCMVRVKVRPTRVFFTVILVIFGGGQRFSVGGRTPTTPPSSIKVIRRQKRSENGAYISRKCCARGTLGAVQWAGMHWYTVGTRRTGGRIHVGTRRDDVFAC